MFLEIVKFAAVIGSGLMAIISLNILVSVARRGPAGIADLMRHGVGIRSWATGRMPESRDGTSIDLIEGIEISAKGRTISDARQTRGLSTER